MSEFVPMPEAIREKYQYFTEAKLDKLRRAGYARPTTTLEDGVADFVKTYLTAADPYR
jgi:ADP-L-glycero-D-manno-heptose 6-epimerase